MDRVRPRRKEERAAQYRSPSFVEWVERISANVRRLRDARKWTQEMAAEACELDMRHFQGLEAGTLNPTITTLAQLTKGLEVDPIELLLATPKPQRRRPGRPRRDS